MPDEGDSKSFDALRKAMSPEAQARAKAKAEQMMSVVNCEQCKDASEWMPDEALAIWHSMDHLETGLNPYDN